MMATENRTTYDTRTPDKVAEILERVRMNGTRIELDYGNIETGLSWGDRYDITGRIGRSMGPSKVPILLHNSRSIGGVSVLDHCIIRIRESRGKRVLYEHPNRHE